MALRLWKKARAQQRAWAAEGKAPSKPSVLARARERLRPLPAQTLAEYMEASIWLPKDVSTESGRVKLYAYQRGIAEAISDPGVERVSVIKSARTGMTTLVVGAMAYRAERAGGNMLLVQPTVDDAEGFGRDQWTPVVRASPSLSRLFPPEKSRDKSQTLRRKEYRGGVMYFVGANSGTGFRRILAPWVLLDEVDAYPASAGDDGDPVKLAEQRGVSAWDRKIVACSTPLVSERSRIEALYMQGDQRRFYVPCPQCGHRDYLVFSRRPSGEGHHMEWPEGDPSAAYFVCSRSGCVIEESEKDAMVAAGEWRATVDGDGSHASFHIWAAYSPHPKARWGAIAAEFLEARGRPEQLKVFINTVLGETWEESGEAPDWERLYHRREQYAVGSVPAEVEFLTCGVDVQRDRFVYEVVGWDFGKRSWSIEIGELYCNTALAASWAKLDELLRREFPGEGRSWTIKMLAVDSSDQTNTVYNWCRRHPMSRVVSVKGHATAKSLIRSPSDVDVTVGGRKLRGAHKLWIVGVAIAKEELFGWLQLPRPDEGEERPEGWCAFPEHGEEYFKQLTAEHLVAEADRKGFIRRVWKKLPGRENHWLDCRVYARAAASILGLDRVSRPAPTAPTSTAKAPAATPAKRQKKPKASPPSSGWVGRSRRSRARGGGWFGK